MAALREDGIDEEDREEYNTLRQQLGELLSQLPRDDEERRPCRPRGDRPSREDREELTPEEREVRKC